MFPYSFSALAECTLCPKGTFGAKQGITLPECSGKCKPGTFSRRGMVYCLDCSPGQYSNASGSDDCSACPTNTTSIVKGASGCVCAASRQFVGKNIFATTMMSSPALSSIHENSQSCRTCPLGASCSKAGMTVANMEVAKGAWRFSQQILEPISCPWKDACMGGNTSSTCPVNYTGVMCAVCQKGYFRWGAADAAPCLICPEDMTSSIAWSVSALVMSIGLLVVFLLFNRKASNGLVRPIINGAQMMIVVMMTGEDWPASLKMIGRVLDSVRYAKFLKIPRLISQHPTTHTHSM